MPKSNQKQLSLRIPANLYDDFQNVCDDIGLTATSALIVYIKAVVNRRKIPFELSAEKVSNIQQIDSNNKANATQELSDNKDFFDNAFKIG